MTRSWPIPHAFVALLALALAACGRHPSPSGRSNPAPVPAPPAAPLATLFTPDGTGLLVIDPGGLTVRDPSTQALKRRLSPELSHWSAAHLDPDGGIVASQYLK